MFDRVQERLQQRSHPRTKHSFPYRGLLTCGYCGCGITTTLAKRKYIYYHCTNGRGRCSQPYVSQDRLGLRLRTVVDGVHLDPEIVAKLLDLIETDAMASESRRAKRIAALRGSEEAIRERMDAAYSDKLDGRITEERWLGFDARQSRRLDMLRREREELAACHEPSLDNIRTTFELLEHAPELYMRQSHEERARVLRTLVSNCYVKGESVEPVYKSPFAEVAAGVETGEWLGEEDSNPH